jgi:hypothetical protein
MRYDLHIDIDYSGAETPEASLKGLQVYAAENGAEPARVAPPKQPPNWSRKEVAEWLVDLGREERRFIAGIDHAFSLPIWFMDEHDLLDWPAFLVHLRRRWQTHERPLTPAEVAHLHENRERDLRLTDTWTSSAKSVFEFGIPGQVAPSTFAGIPWLAHIREALGDRVHFWPFDGWDVPGDRSVIVEAYPSIFRRRYPAGDRGPDAQDAYAIARWLRDRDDRGLLGHYFQPPLTEAEAQQARREGWIVGIT